MEADRPLIGTLSTASTDTAQLERFFDTLMAENGPALFRLAGGFTGTTADRDDLFQEMVLAIWQALPNFRGECSGRTYFFRIAHNRGIAYLVSRRMLQTIEDEELLLPDPSPGPERQVEAKEQRQSLLHAVRRLPFVYRDVVTLALEGLTYSEIAAVLGVTEANVGIRLNRAKAALRRLLEKQK